MAPCSAECIIDEDITERDWMKNSFSVHSKVISDTSEASSWGGWSLAVESQTHYFNLCLGPDNGPVFSKLKEY